MRMIVGCEKSQVITKTAREYGIEAYSCDIQPCSGGYPDIHIQDDVFNHLKDGWDVGVFHPDCSRTANSGVRWYHELPQYKAEMMYWVDFFNALLGCDDIPRRMLENPIHHKYARQYIRKYDQLIQPWQFGDMESKATCLWLVNIPKLEPIITVKPEGVKQSVWHEAPGLDRKNKRSQTFPGVAKGIVKAILRSS